MIGSLQKYRAARHHRDIQRQDRKTNGNPNQPLHIADLQFGFFRMRFREDHAPVKLGLLLWRLAHLLFPLQLREVSLTCNWRLSTREAVA